MSKLDFIGYLTGRHVLCSPCTAQASGDTAGGFEWEFVRLYAVNVGQYGQRCHVCHVPLSLPSPGWPTDLFDERDCPTCREQPTLCLRCRRAGGVAHEAKVCIDPGVCACACTQGKVCCDEISLAPCNTCYAELGAG